jgi:hypothetical protein
VKGRCRDGGRELYIHELCTRLERGWQVKGSKRNVGRGGDRRGWGSFTTVECITY